MRNFSRVTSHCSNFKHCLFLYKLVGGLHILQLILMSHDIIPPTCVMKFYLPEDNLQLYLMHSLSKCTKKFSFTSSNLARLFRISRKHDIFLKPQTKTRHSELEQFASTPRSRRVSKLTSRIFNSSILNKHILNRSVWHPTWYCLLSQSNYNSVLNWSHFLLCLAFTKMPPTTAHYISLTLYSLIEMILNRFVVCDMGHSVTNNP